MKISHAFIILVFALAGQTITAQTGDAADKYPETMIITVIEINTVASQNTWASAIDPKIIIVNSDNQSEIKHLKDLKIFGDNTERTEDNMKRVRTELQIWHNKGFMVKSSSSAVTVLNVITTIILQKN